MEVRNGIIQKCAFRKLTDVRHPNVRLILASISSADILRRYLVHKCETKPRGGGVMWSNLKECID